MAGDRGDLHETEALPEEATGRRVPQVMESQVLAPAPADPLEGMGDGIRAHAPPTPSYRP